MFIFISQCIILQTSFPKLKEYGIAFDTVCSYFLVHFCTVRQQKRIVSNKGQLISEGNFGVFKSP